MLLAELVATTNTVGSTRARSAKTAALAELLARLAPEEISAAVGFLIGWPRQGKIGVGWRALSAARPAPAQSSTLTVAEVDVALDALAITSGTGSSARRSTLLAELLGSATEEEQDFVARVLI